MKMGPGSYSRLFSASALMIADELREYVHALVWLNKSIPHFTKSTIPLHEQLEETYQKSRERTKQSLAKSFSYIC